MKSLPQPPVELFDLAIGYQKSKTLFACLEFGIPTLLAQGELSLSDIAHQLRLHPIAADRLLNACTALGLLERVGVEYCNTELSDTFLVQGKPTYLGAQYLNYDRTSYENWSQLTQKLREWRPGETNAQPPQEEDQGSESLSAQHNLAVLVGHALAKAYDFSRHRLLLDLGGGTGAMSIGICGVHHELTSIVYDLPQIGDAARRFIEEAGLSARITVTTGDFKQDELPDGFDVVLLANFLSVSSEETNRQLLKKLYERLPGGGAVILSGWILEDTRTAPLIPLLFCLEDINWQAPDVERSFQTYEEWLAAAGFVNIKHEMYCPPTSMIVGRKG
ncbi:MAG: acetylserotonin O-methyltransferase [Acidobacteriota bacterium]|nr:acetylserotonin O-methyltransferase [Acidobacteriota bacterium]